MEVQFLKTFTKEALESFLCHGARVFENKRRIYWKKIEFYFVDIMFRSKEGKLLNLFNTALYSKLDYVVKLFEVNRFTRKVVSDFQLPET